MSVGLSPVGAKERAALKMQLRPFRYFPIENTLRPSKIDSSNKKRLVRKKEGGRGGREVKASDVRLKINPS